MTAPAEPLKPTPEQARTLAALEDRIRTLNNQLAIEHRINEVLRGQLADRTDERDQARRNVEQQQAEFAEWRLRPNPRSTRRTTHHELPKEN